MRLTQSNNRVFRLEISMDNFANSMEIVKTNKDLFRNPPNKRDRNALIIIALHDFKEIYSEDLKNHNEVVSIRSIMHERVEQLDYLSVLTGELAIDHLNFIFLSLMILLQTLKPLWIVNILSDYVKNFNFVISSNLVTWSTFLHF
jgi:hypothetical protein